MLPIPRVKGFSRGFSRGFSPTLPAIAGVLLVAACHVRPTSGSVAADNAAQEAGLRSIPKIDVHAHYRTDTPELVPTLAAWNVRAVLVNVTGSDRKIDEKWRDFRALHAAHSDRFFLVATFDPFRFNAPDFVASTIAQLRADIAAGAKGVKVWKDIGIEPKDDRGMFVQIDHPRFQAILDFLAEQHIPVMAHIGEPLAALPALHAARPHLWYYTDH